MIDYEKELNPDQLKVVREESGQLLVLAGAGSGKTRTLTYRVAYLLEKGIAPENILLATFTNKAARSMLHRVESLAETYTGKIIGGTFHHIAHVILRRYASLLGYRANFSIMDSEDARQLISTCISDLKIETKSSRFPKSNILGDIISLVFNTQSTLEDILYARYPYYSHLIEEISQIASLYTVKKRELCAMDFDDLLLNLKTLLVDNPDILQNLSGRFRHILVDEYQDVNIIQADIVDLLARGHGNLMVVGDDAQSIYSFRGASFESIITFPRRYPDCKIYKLETNYRSTPEILNLANLSIMNNINQYPKELSAVRSSGMRPVIVHAQNVLKQADFVAQRVMELYQSGVHLSEIAVLYRAHYHSMELQMELVRREIPFDIRSGIRFFEQAHIKDVTSYMRIMINQHDELAWRRVLQMYPKIGNKTFIKIWSMLGKTQKPLDEFISEQILENMPAAAKNGLKTCINHMKRIYESPAAEITPVKVIDLLLNKADYREYLHQNYTDASSREEDLMQLAAFSEQFTTMEEFLNELALLTNMASKDGYEEEEKGEKLILSTIHQAKGLEWSYVFLIWCTDGMMPLARALKERDGEEEERRLFYVALTRAKDELYLCCPALDYSRGMGNIALAPSRFINEITPFADEGKEKPFEQWTLYAEY